MNELGQQFGLGGEVPPSGGIGGYEMMGSPMQSMGMPQDQMMDPQLEMLVQQVSEQYGIQPEQALELIMAQSQEQMPNTSDILGQRAPQLSDEDFYALAQQFGLSPEQGFSGVGSDPSYGNDYDVARLLGGSYGA